MKRGKPKKEAQRIAAATYNKRHPGHPMRPHRKKQGFPKADRHGYY